MDQKSALIQKADELHLHLRSADDSQRALTSADVISLVDCVNQSVGFCLGFNPWPVYREILVDHVVVERWIRPKMNLPTTYLAPISEQLWDEFRSDYSHPMHSIIPCVADGLGDLPKANLERLKMLLWHMRSISFSTLPSSTRLLAICVLLDAMTKLIARAEPEDEPATNEMWTKASKELGISWDGWTSGVFERWGKYRHRLAHGWLWLDDLADPKAFFIDFPKLGSSFVIMVACLCGYRGPIQINPFEGEVVDLRDILDKK